MAFDAKKTAAALITMLYFVAAAFVQPAHAAQAAGGRSVSGRVIMESGVIPQRFTLPLSSPGKAAASVVITPQPDGAFQSTLPVGMSVVGTPGNLPAGTTVLGLKFGATDLTKEPLVVDANSDAQLLVTLRGPRPMTVSGRVTGLASTQGVLIALQNQAFSQASSIETLLNPDGAFKLTNVAPGSYRLRVIGGFLEKTVTLTVGNTDPADVNIAMPQERYVTGLVIVDGYAGPVPAIAAEARTVDGRVLKSAAPTAYEGTNTGQFFLFRLINGEYRVSVPSIPAGYTLKSLTYGEIDLQQNALKLDGTPYWNIVVHLTRAGE